MMTMTGDEPSSIQTRPSLLHRLREGDDVESWQEFYRVYGKLARDFAIKAGLTDTEADEVVQEVAIGVARHLPGFSYDPKVCRFKTWLLNQTSWRIKDQIKKRARASQSVGAGASDVAPDPIGTATINRVADPAAVDLDVLFESQWHTNLLAVALDRLKDRFSLKQIQIFDLVVAKEWPAGEVARSLGVSLANVYVTKHRVAAAVKREAKRIENEMEPR
jgi:RNA polymerase sigma-70 factor (ECF subfamily)